MDRQVFVLCTDRVTLVTTATGERRWEKNDESRDGKVRDWACGEQGRGGER